MGVSKDNPSSNFVGRVRLPLDRLPELWPKELKNAAVGAVLHPASVSSTLLHASEVLHSHDGNLFRLKALFGPQHGYLGQTQDNMIEWGGFHHPRWNIPVYSLYGDHREPDRPEMLAGLDALMVDLQDVGARYYTFIWTLFLCLRACERRAFPSSYWIDPILSAMRWKARALDRAYASFVGCTPCRCGMAKPWAQLARQFRTRSVPHIVNYAYFPWKVMTPNATLRPPACRGFCLRRTCPRSTPR